MSNPLLRRHEAHAQAGVALDYLCSHCGWEGEAAAMGQGTSVRTAPLGDDGEEAALSAQGMAISEAKDHIGLAPCPACKKRQPGAWIRVLTPRLAVLLIAVGAGFAAGAFFADKADSPGFILLFGAIALGLSATRALAVLRLIRGQGSLSFKPGA
jgi:hypothetical protein